MRLLSSLKGEYEVGNYSVHLSESSQVHLQIQSLGFKRPNRVSNMEFQMKKIVAVLISSFLVASAFAQSSTAGSSTGSAAGGATGGAAGGAAATSAAVGGVSVGVAAATNNNSNSGTTGTTR